MSSYKCCSSPSIVSYDLKKYDELLDSQKLELSTIMQYLPETTSERSKKNTIFSIISDVSIILDELKLDASEFICLTDKDESEKYEDAFEFYKSNYCQNCEKIIFTNLDKKKTSSISFFGHIRNMLAHGRLYIKDNYFIGIDVNRGQDTACIVSMDYQKYISGMTKLISYDDFVFLFSYVLTHLGYKILKPNILLSLTCV